MSFQRERRSARWFRGQPRLLEGPARSRTRTDGAETVSASGRPVGRSEVGVGRTHSLCSSNGDGNLEPSRRGTLRGRCVKVADISPNL